MSRPGAHFPTWAEFEESPVPDLAPRSPAAELAEVLQRCRADLEAAARAGAESRVQGLRALAEQAVLAVELEHLIDGPAAWPADGSLERLFGALRNLQERMLSHIAAAGLEVVRLRGASAGSVRDIIEIDCWRYDAAYPGEVVVDEIEVAVRFDGAPVRMGRVVMGAPCEAPSLGWGADGEPSTPAPAAALPAGTTGPAPPAGPRAGALAAAPAVAPAPASPAALPPAGGRIVCPVAGCGAENDAEAEVCVGCLAHLAGYIRLLAYPHVLFNRGLKAARAGDSRRARDCFAAVVQWQPDDVRTRNAYALACVDLRDRPAAQRAWEEVLSRSPRDAIATRGLSALARTTAPPAG